MSINDQPDIPTTAPSDQLPRRLVDKLKIQVPGYKLVSIIGRGGQAVVAKAIRESTGKLVAIKLLREGPLADERARDRFQRETAVLAALDHPNIVTIIDRGQTPDGYDFLVMNYIAGQPLDVTAAGTDALAERPADPSAMLKLFIKICQAVNAAHLQGIVHRDLSPSNIIIDEHGEPHILDFGLARTAFDRFLGSGKNEITIDGQFLGKVGYASPEQARGDHQRVDIRTDVYALGVILYQMLTGGQYPYNVVGNMLEVLDNIIHAVPTPPSHRIEQGVQPLDKQQRPLRTRTKPVVNPVIEAIAMKALAKNPADRYQSAGEFARDVENYLAGQSTLATVGRMAHRHPRRVLDALHSALRRPALRRTVIALAAVVLLFIGGWRLFPSSSSERQQGVDVSASSSSAIPRRIESLKEAYKNDFLIGVALEGTLPRDYSAAEVDLVKSQFSALTPESCLMPIAVHPDEDHWEFAQADALAEFARANGMQVTGHTLVQGTSYPNPIFHSRTPEWFFLNGKKPASRDVVLARLKSHIETVVTRYKGKVRGWNVVNEALNSRGGLVPDPWVKAIGEDYVVQAFKFAHQADPDAELYYNDLGVEENPKRGAAIALIKRIQAAGVPVTAVGIEGHWALDKVPLTDIEAAIEEFRKAGVKVNISELDIDVLPAGAPTVSNLSEVLELQAQQYSRLFTLFHKRRDDILRVGFWQLNDGRSWLNNWPRARTNHPLLFDRADRPKPALRSVIDVVAPANSRDPSQSEVSRDANGASSSSTMGPIAKRGTWRIENQELVAVSGGEIVFGDPHWSSYELSFQARAEHEPTVFGGMVHRFSEGYEHRFLLGMGAGGNDGGRLLKIRGGPRPDWSSSKDTHIEYGHWYDIRIDARPPYYHCFVDGQLWAEGSADPTAEGQVGLQAHWLAGPVHFRNLKVTSVDGRVLWSGLPDLNVAAELPVVQRGIGDDAEAASDATSGTVLPRNSVWTGTWPAGRGDWDSVVFVVNRREENSFTAIFRCTNREKTVWAQIVHGQIDGNQIRWNSGDVQVKDGAAAHDQTGTIEGDKLTFDWSGRKGPPTRVLQRAH
jgi:endo-1,4-beta-xylanase